MRIQSLNAFKNGGCANRERTSFRDFHKSWDKQQKRDEIVFDLSFRCQVTLEFDCHALHRYIEISIGTYKCISMYENTCGYT